MSKLLQVWSRIASERPENVVWNNSWHKSNALTQAGCWPPHLGQKAEPGGSSPTPNQPDRNFVRKDIILLGILVWELNPPQRDSRCKKPVQEQPLSDGHKEVCFGVHILAKPKCHLFYFRWLATKFIVFFMMTKIKKQCAWPKGDFSFENTLSSRKHSCAKFPIFIKISSIMRQNPFNFNILAHLIFTPCCSECLLKEILNQR